MKILFVCSGNNKFGISPIIKSQAESLKENGVYLDYFTITGKGFKGYFKNIFGLKKYLKKNKINLIHAHFGLSGIVSNLARTSENLVVSFMGSDLIGSNKEDGSYTLMSKLWVQINKYFAYNRFDFIIVKSNNIKEKIRKVKNIKVIPNGVNLKVFYPVNKNVSRKKLKLSNDKKIILFVTNPSRKEKNYSLAKKAYNLLHSYNVELKVVYEIDQEILNLYYNAADLLILTSFHEGSPNVIKEAMACNCPIVSTDVGDVRKIIENIPGCFLTTFDPEDVVYKIRKALDFAENDRKTNGRLRIIELGLDTVTVAQKLIAIYNDVLFKNYGSLVNKKNK